MEDQLILDWLLSKLAPLTDPDNWVLDSYVVSCYGTSLGGQDRVTNGGTKYRWFLASDPTIADNDWLITKSANPAGSVKNRMKNPSVKSLLSTLYSYGFFKSHDLSDAPEALQNKIANGSDHQEKLIRGAIKHYSHA